VPDRDHGQGDADGEFGGEGCQADGEMASAAVIQALRSHDAEVAPGALLEVLTRAVAEANRELGLAGGHWAHLHRRGAARAANPGRVTPLVRVPGPPLRAGPVRMEDPRPAPSAGGWDEQNVRLAVLVELALRYLAADRGRPW
jgi:hypothetical protein